MLVKPSKLKKGDYIAIVSLSQGTLGEEFAKHQLKLGSKRLEELGLFPIFMQNSLKGIDYLKKNPEARAEDLKDAFRDNKIKGIISAIGGDDTYKLIPYLMEDNDFKTSVIQNPKLFSGFSDTTINHLMFYKIGMQTFYGPSFLNDLAELDTNMLPYTLETFNQFFVNPTYSIIPSSHIWYDERTDFSTNQSGTPRKKHLEKNGYLTLRGEGKIEGRLLGGCIESINDLITGSKYSEEKNINKKYKIFPSINEWNDKILFIETSEEQTNPDKYYDFLLNLDNLGVLKAIKAMIVGKPQNEKYFKEYQKILLNVTEKYKTPILYNCNFGHSYPRTALPYGVNVEINFTKQELATTEKWFAN